MTPLTWYTFHRTTLFGKFTNLDWYQTSMKVTALSFTPSFKNMYVMDASLQANEVYVSKHKYIKVSIVECKMLVSLLLEWRW